MKEAKINLIKKIKNKQGEIIRDSKRSFIKKVKVKDKYYIFKKPRGKNNRKWIRFLSLFRSSEVKKEYLSMKRLRKNDILSPEPIAYHEEKYLGMVLDSWFIYEYKDGRVSQKEDMEKVVDVLRKIHKLNRLHGDPQFRNFIKDTNGEIFIIDCTLKRNYLGRFSEAFEYIRLERSIGNLDEKLSFIKGTGYYKVAYIYDSMWDIFKKIKKKVRFWRK
ncbi:MAG: RIO1 family regulatory kinase/ATPase [Fusobacteriota bacterium]